MSYIRLCSHQLGAFGRILAPVTYGCSYLCIMAPKIRSALSTLPIKSNSAFALQHNDLSRNQPSLLARVALVLILMFFLVVMQVGNTEIASADTCATYEMGEFSSASQRTFSGDEQIVSWACDMNITYNLSITERAWVGASTRTTGSNRLTLYDSEGNVLDWAEPNPPVYQPSYFRIGESVDAGSYSIVYETIIDGSVGYDVTVYVKEGVNVVPEVTSGARQTGGKFYIDWDDVMAADSYEVSARKPRMLGGETFVLTSAQGGTPVASETTVSIPSYIGYYDFTVSVKTVEGTITSSASNEYSFPNFTPDPPETAQPVAEEKSATSHVSVSIYPRCASDRLVKSRWTGLIKPKLL